MSSVSPFQPLSLTFGFAATSSAGTAIQVTGSTVASNYLLVNSGADAVWITLAATSTGAAQTIPTTSAAGNALYVKAGAAIVLTGPPQAWVNAQAAASTTTLWITAGDGGLISV